MLEATIAEIRALPPGLARLAETAHGEGHGMVRRLVTDFTSGANRFDGPGEGLWVATAENGVIGVVGLNRDPFAESSERAGRVRRLYVAPGFRRTGVASHLLAAVVDRARVHFAVLTAFTTSEPAIAFYLARGFERVHGFERRTVIRDLAREATG